MIFSLVNTLETRLERYLLTVLTFFRLALSMIIFSCSHLHSGASELDLTFSISQWSLIRYVISENYHDPILIFLARIVVRAASAWQCLSIKIDDKFLVSNTPPINVTVPPFRSTGLLGLVVSLFTSLALSSCTVLASSLSANTYWKWRRRRNEGEDILSGTDRLK